MNEEISRVRPRLVAAGLFAATLALLPWEAPAQTRLAFGDGLVAFVDEEQEIFLEALPQAGEAWVTFAERICGDRGAVATLQESSGLRNLMRGVRYRAPLDCVRPELQVRVFESLFPADSREGRGWVHRVVRSSRGPAESLWRVSVWFTGDGQNFRALREANQLPDTEIEVGQEILIPRHLLRSALRGALPPPPVEPAPTPAADTVFASNPGAPHDLSFGQDAEGGYASYALRPGEALYSSVVVRFTGRIYAEDVNALAQVVARRSGIVDVTDIPVGYRVKIPLDLLEPQFLPAGDPRRVEWETGQVQAARSGVTAQHLEGVTIVLDAGHGGQDVGAMGGSDVWESLYVYDIVQRVRHLLQTRTAADVIVTTRDGPEHRFVDSDVLPRSRGHAVLTEPPYSISDSRVGVNLRWYLANSRYRAALERSPTAREKSVFLSIHADSLHPSLRGAMVYVADTQLTAGRNDRLKGSVYSARREYREQPAVEFTWNDRMHSEAVSRRFADQLLDAFRSGGLPIHSHQPVRDRIIRGRRTYVPAVLRYNAIPTKVLLEVCNLANSQDRTLLQSHVWRQRMAVAVVNGLFAYFGEPGWREDDLMTTTAGG